MIQQLKKNDLLLGFESEDKAYLVEDYPYGFRLRCQIKYWIETTKHGDRFCSQTLNPKNDRWNAPKKSTYVDFGIMFLDEKGHVTWTAIRANSDTAEADVQYFINLMGGEHHLSPLYQQKIKDIRTLIKIQKKWSERFSQMNTQTQVTTL